MKLFVACMAWLAAAAALELAELQTDDAALAVWHSRLLELELQVSFFLGQGLGPRGPRALGQG